MPAWTPAATVLAPTPPAVNPTLVNITPVSDLRENTLTAALTAPIAAPLPVFLACYLADELSWLDMFFIFDLIIIYYPKLLI